MCVRKFNKVATIIIGYFGRKFYLPYHDLKWERTGVHLKRRFDLRIIGTAPAHLYTMTYWKNNTVQINNLMTDSDMYDKVAEKNIDTGIL